MERVPWHKALFDRALARVQKSHVLFSPDVAVQALKSTYAILECVRAAERIILHVFIAAKDTGKGAKSVFLFANY